MNDPENASGIDDRYPRLHWRLDPPTWSAFRRFGVTQDVEAGHVVFSEGTPSISLVLVAEGELVISRAGRELARVGENYSVGEMGLLLDMPRAATATASRPTKVLELSRADLLRMQEEAPLVSTRLYRVLAECLADYLHRESRK